ncbi:hypothetical protein EMPS_09978 [Entomortierella parvispora]|uniref:Uncharacterized protein n=1 Tax=Entomortierella parvispora TaxID=205924 RepID=A0A9P3M0S5_9FUNG|nr:hypothetical protein EMPS_09978 [Entomortierella parvispora]
MNKHQQASEKGLSASELAQQRNEQLSNPPKRQHGASTQSNFKRDPNDHRNDKDHSGSNKQHEQQHGSNKSSSSSHQKKGL